MESKEKTMTHNRKYWKIKMRLKSSFEEKYEKGNMRDIKLQLCTLETQIWFN